MIRDITIRPRGPAQQDEILARIRRVAGVKVIGASDRVFQLHLGGKNALQDKALLTARDALPMACTPGEALGRGYGT